MNDYYNEFMTIDEAAEKYGKTKSNINYLIQYKRLTHIKNTKKGKLLNKAELEEYFNKLKSERIEIKNQFKGMNEELAFFDLPERERTKHVHRLHPYLGKYIPQLVEYYLKKNFTPGQTILDPFIGSGTTLVESNIFGVNSIGVDISEFNCIISKAKTQKYNLHKVEFELLDILKKVKSFFINNQKTLLDFISSDRTDQDKKEFSVIDSDYLNTWFAKSTIEEISLYRSLIPQYEYQDLLKVVLSRTARSSRLTLHFELTRPTHPVREPYYCHKHKGKICVPVQTSLPHLRRYTKDTIKRLKEFDKLRTGKEVTIIRGDSTNIRLEDEIGFYPEINGIITSPPYVGVIDYHDQHKYAYEIYNLEWNDDKEIGPAKKGSSKLAQKEYQNLIIKVLKNYKKYLKDHSKVFFVANDKHNLYPEIIEKSGYTLLHEDIRPVTRKASRERAVYSESIFEFTPD